MAADRSSPPAPGADWTMPAALLAAFCVIFVALGIAPLYRQDWLLENVLVFIAVPLLVATRHRMRFSHLAYACLFVFFCVHEVGAHYTYSLVPYDEWFHSLTGRSLDAMLGFERNHYDRLVHFLYGLLVTPAAVELFARFGGELGQAYLGTQGDIWDAQKDMALALLGSVVAIVVLGLAGRLPVRR